MGYPFIKKVRAHLAIPEGGGMTKKEQDAFNLGAAEGKAEASAAWRKGYEAGKQEGARMVRETDQARRRDGKIKSIDALAHAVKALANLAEGV